MFAYSHDITREQFRTQIEDEIARAAVNNWPKATAKLLKRFKDVDISLDKAFMKVNERVEYQLATVGDNDDYTDVLWVLLKSKRHSRLGRSYALGVAVVMGKFWLIHYIMKHGGGNAILKGYDKRDGAKGLYLSGMWEISDAYRNGTGLFVLLDHYITYSFPKYRHNKLLFPRKEEPSYDHWMPSTNMSPF